MHRVKPIAIVLPQFHPVPENDSWWGPGFTEWRNVVKGQPRFRGHYQPHLPADLGYYDLRLAATRQAQADLAAKYGIYGFCYYHYWFGGRRILEAPVESILTERSPDFPFMLCWANENWSRNWDGGNREILIRQEYSVSDFVSHARHLVPYFHDSRYIRCGGRPIFAIYKDLDALSTPGGIDAFRDELARHDIDVCLMRFERRSGTSPRCEETFRTFEAGIEFQPLTPRLEVLLQGKKTRISKVRARLERKLNFKRRDVIIDYRDIVENDLAHDFQCGYPIYPGVSPGWDNSARRPPGHALIANNSTPDLFREWLKRKIAQTDWGLLPDRFVFINAWNEWAEGNHLEPCERWGHAYLQAVREALD